MSVDFPKTSFGITSMGDIYTNYQHLELASAFSYRLNHKATFGFSPILVIQSFQINLPFANNAMISTLSGVPTPGATITNLSLNQSYSYGGRFSLGFNYQADENNLIGFSYKTKSFTGNFKWNTNNFGQVVGNLNVPERYSIGYSHKWNHKFRTELDIDYISHNHTMKAMTLHSSKTNAFNNYSSMIKNMLGGNISKDGQTLSYPFEWKHQYTEAFTLEYIPSEKLSLSLGINYGKSPIKNNFLFANVGSTGIDELHYTFGFSYKYNTNNEISFSFVHAMDNTEYNSNPLTSAYLSALRMNQNTYSIELSHKF
jgi:long-chain fatty acid transport protein